jgi:PadR family transcriptional regulator PadR
MIDPQMKRGLLDTCVLSVLSREDSYGYKIIRDISGCIEISESTLYPILRRLEAAGCLTDYSVPHNGRLRKFYRITAEGKAQIEAFLENWREMSAIYEFIREGRDHDKS